MLRAIVSALHTSRQESSSACHTAYAACSQRACAGCSMCVYADFQSALSPISPSLRSSCPRCSESMGERHWAHTSQVPDSHFGWYAPFCRCDNSTQDTSSQSGPNLGWQCVSQGVRKTSRCNARAFPAQSTDLFCALHLLLRQLQDPHLRRKSRSPKVRYALFVSSARVDTDTTLPHMTSTIAAAVY